jgi:uncharacterized protein YbjT (DUF2867 family)
MDTMDATQPTVAVVGATGYTGRFVVADLLRRGITPIAIARNAAALDAAHFDTHVVRRQATVDEAASLDRALQGAQAKPRQNPIYNSGELRRPYWIV